MMMRSVQVPAFQAAMTPIGTAMTTEKTRVAAARAKVGSRRCPMRCATGRSEKIETPRSPERIEPTQVKNWMWTGRSRPSWWRMRAMSSGRA